MTPPEVGKLVPLSAPQYRDAIHVAIMPVMVGEYFLKPGQHVKVVRRHGSFLVEPSEADLSIGIIDPFLERQVAPGHRCYLWMKQNTIVGLRHEWAHPMDETGDLEVEKPVLADLQVRSEQWLREFCAAADCPGYERVMRAIRGAGEKGDRLDEEYLQFKGTDAHGEIPMEFWHHVEIVLGQPVRYKAQYFGCSC